MALSATVPNKAQFSNPINADLPFNKAFIDRLAHSFPTPFYLYDEVRIRANARNFKEVMKRAGLNNFINYFAVKALPNPHILRILKEEGMGVDCSSLAELKLAQMCGFSDDQIVFTSNNTTLKEFEAAQKLDAIINFDDLSLVGPFLSNIGQPQVASARYNPGNISFEGINQAIIGKPSEAKYGMTKPQIIQAYKTLKTAGVKRFGLHTMLLSNELDYKNHERIADLLFELAVDITKQTGVQLEFINLGGGIGVPYNLTDKAFDIESFATAIKKLYKKYKLEAIGAPRIVMENGRYITADAGYLITKVINLKDTHKIYVGVDATMANLMRPGMYGAYHHITVLGKGNSKSAQKVDVVGSLCENNDKFAIDRFLPKVGIGDYLVIHTTGAHGHAMGFQYNGKLRSAELLLHPDKSVKLIRRAETLDDYFATLVK